MIFEQTCMPPMRLIWSLGRGGNGGQGGGTPKGSVIPEIHYPESQEMVSAVPRVGVHGKALPQSRLQRKADRHAHQRQTVVLRGRTLFGGTQEEVHDRKGGFQVVKDPADKSKLALAINGQQIGEWFKEQFNKLSSSIRRTVTPLTKSKRLEL